MKKTVIIIGAGISGLTFAYKLALAGKHRVIVIEKEKIPGGLARSFTYNGDATFDIGPHRFHTDDIEVNNLINEVLAEDKIDILRSSGVWMFGKYYRWPLRASEAFRLPKKLIVKSGFDIITRGFHKNKEKTFADYVISRYGKNLFNIFFEPYTKKFIGHSSWDISEDWGKVGIDRAIIDKQHKLNNVFQLINSLILPKPENLKFIYPSTGGTLVFSEILVEKIKSLGGEVHLDNPVTSLKTRNGVLIEIRTQNGSVYDSFDSAVFTSPINQIYSMLFGSTCELRFLDTVLYNVIIEDHENTDFQWCYYGTDDIIFNRISVPTNFNKKTMPNGLSGICVEITSRENSYVWKNPSHKINNVIRDLVKAKLVRYERDILEVFIEKVENTYPIYVNNYHEMTASTMNQIKSKVTNIDLLGRSAAFWYNNMDHSIKMALNLANKYTNENYNHLSTAEIFS